MSERVVVIMRGERRLIPEFLLDSFEQQAKKLLAALEEKNISPESFFADEKSRHIFLRQQQLASLAEDLGWAWLTQIYLPVQKNNNTPCPRSRVWVIREKMQRDNEIAMPFDIAMN